MTLASHVDFIVAAYGAAFVILSVADPVDHARLSRAQADARRFRGRRRDAPLGPPPIAVVTTDPTASAPALFVAIPLVVFLALAGLFLYRLGAGDPSRIPSALIGREAPQTDLPPVDGPCARRRAGAGTERRRISPAR